MRNRHFLTSRFAFSRFASEDDQATVDYILDLLEKAVITKYRKKTIPLRYENGFTFYFRYFKGVVYQHKNDPKKIVFEAKTLGDYEVPDGEVIDAEYVNIPMGVAGDYYPNTPEYKITQKLMMNFFDDFVTMYKRPRTQI